MIGIIGYGSGNVRAITNVYERLKVECEVVSTPKDVMRAKRLILPGVGAFDESMQALVTSGLLDTIAECVFEANTPLLGICVGMQLLADGSEEGRLPGLGWVSGEVRRMRPPDARSHPVPHMGWNIVRPLLESSLFEGVDLSVGYYFLHSYAYVCADSSDELAISNYHSEFTSAVSRRNIFGVQFHPEKSHQPGVRLLQNFACTEVRQSWE